MVPAHPPIIQCYRPHLYTCLTFLYYIIPVYTCIYLCMYCARLVSFGDVLITCTVISVVFTCTCTKPTFVYHLVHRYSLLCVYVHGNQGNRPSHCYRIGYSRQCDVTHTRDTPLSHLISTVLPWRQYSACRGGGG